MTIKLTKIPLDLYVDKVRNGDKIFTDGIYIHEKTEFYALIRSYYGKFILVKEYDNGTTEEHEVIPINISTLPTWILRHIKMRVPHELLVTFEKVPVKINLRWYSLTKGVTETDMLIHAELILESTK